MIMILHSTGHPCLLIVAAHVTMLIVWISLSFANSLANEHAGRNKASLWRNGPCRFRKCWYNWDKRLLLAEMVLCSESQHLVQGVPSSTSVHRELWKHSSHLLGNTNQQPERGALTWAGSWTIRGQHKPPMVRSQAAQMHISHSCDMSNSPQIYSKLHCKNKIIHFFF